MSEADFSHAAGRRSVNLPPIYHSGRVEYLVRVLSILDRADDLLCYFDGVVALVSSMDSDGVCGVDAFDGEAGRGIEIGYAGAYGSDRLGEEDVFGHRVCGAEFCSALDHDLACAQGEAAVGDVLGVETSAGGAHRAAVGDLFMVPPEDAKQSVWLSQFAV